MVRDNWLEETEDKTMKQKIFSKGNGWYISATNYKDEKDKAYINLFFPKNSDPFYQDNGRGFSVKDIDIQEAKFTSYKGKVGLTIFKYEELSELPMTEENAKGGYADVRLNNGDTDMFGSKNYIDSDELPFY